MAQMMGTDDEIGVHANDQDIGMTEIIPMRICTTKGTVPKASKVDDTTMMSVEATTMLTVMAVEGDLAAHTVGITEAGLGVGHEMLENPRIRSFLRACHTAYRLWRFVGRILRGRRVTSRN